MSVEIKVSTREIRDLALALLDDDYGINEKACNHLVGLLDKAGLTKIVDVIDGCEGRFYLDDEVAKDL